ncbi:MAG: undecaprenyldiphospho-muramoylpentapeptide beta-N-acetylglucosaminyltransferase [Bacteroidales bacterium]|nr:undecaprenyldiphospho-muramoylpentapeptide beta-N-acetylglucosaminyltransferase [Bacteroidales bacterium]
MKPIRAIISGGGTGGHIFPALSIAAGLKAANPETEILFIGANNRMEMEKVPAAGYKIIGLDVAGLLRRITFENLKVPFKVIKSIRSAKRIIKEFKPDIVIGVGGYVSAPVLYAATILHIPTLIQEQNGFAGLTNRILGKRVDCICVAYDGLERFFPKEKIVFSGNPTRSNIVKCTPQMHDEGLEFYGLDKDKKHIFVVGGSLGCRTLNTFMQAWITDGIPDGIQIIWQCGKKAIDEMESFVGSHPEVSGKVLCTDFIARMDLAYAVSDLVVSRSGASSISELCIAGCSTIFVPSKNVTEDHQRHNAMALVNKGAAKIVLDDDVPEKLRPLILETLADEEGLAKLRENILKLSKTDSVEIIINEIYKLVK